METKKATKVVNEKAWYALLDLLHDAELSRTGRADMTAIRESAVRAREALQNS